MQLTSNEKPRVAEFFAGIGLVRMGLEREGFRVVFANDISTDKYKLYAANFDASHYLVADIHNLSGDDIPDIEIATASFPCTDVSVAGGRAGLNGSESGTVWHFLRVVDEMRERRPRAVMLENVAGLSTSGAGMDLYKTIASLNGMGYSCDIFVVDAKWFVPQSRERVFVVGSLDPRAEPGGWQPSPIRPKWIERFVTLNPDLQLHAAPLRLPEPLPGKLEGVVDRYPESDLRWWTADRVGAFIDSLSPLQATRLDLLQSAQRLVWRTAYRRTRRSKPVWEIRSDEISGCLRTARGGSSKQALVEAGFGRLRVRWMTSCEYARLQGAPELRLDSVTENQALFGLGDAVCVPVIAFIAQSYLRPLIVGQSRYEVKELAGAFA